MTKYVTFYIDLFITLQAYNTAYDLCLQAIYSGITDEELTDQYYYLRSVFNGN